MNEPPINPREREFRGWKPEVVSPAPQAEPETPVVDARARLFGILSFVLGLATLLMPHINLWILIVFFVLAIVGVVLGALARRGGARGLATAGLVMNMISCVIYPLTILSYYLLLTGVSDSSMLGL